VTKSKGSDRKKRTGTPGWATAPFKQFLEDVERLSHVVRLSARGISMLRAAPNLMEALMKVEEDSSKSKKTQLNDAKKEADLAQREVDSGFPVLHGWGIRWNSGTD
jgi:hypothetical protein